MDRVVEHACLRVSGSGDRSGVLPGHGQSSLNTMRMEGYSQASLWSESWAKALGIDLDEIPD